MNALATTKDLTKKYQVTRGTVNNWRLDGLPSIKIGRLVRFDYDAVDKWIKDGQGR